MNIFKTQNQLFISTLLFLIGLILSCNVFANKKNNYIIGNTGPAGGIIFQLSADGQHGLEAAQGGLENSNRAPWTPSVIQISATHAVKTGLYDGNFNTDLIITVDGDGSSEDGASYSPAMLCANFNGGGYGDWYLPSKDELGLMFSNLHQEGLGNFTADTYWSSSEYNTYDAWAQDFNNGDGDGASSYNGRQRAVGKRNYYAVRPVRAF